MYPYRFGRIAIPMLLVLGCLPAALLAADKFEKTRVYLERNLADNDAEVKFEAVGGGGGMTSLKVVAPDGRTVIDFRTPDSKLGIRHLALESPEPKNDGSVQADFPAGTYTFSAGAADGSRLEGQAVLSHGFPEPTAFVRPKADASDVPVNGLTISWRPIKGLDAHVVVIEQEATGRELRANLSGTATSFTVPGGFLLPATEYKLAIGTIAKGGNSSFIETGFSTARK